ncbi:hypothetical protein K4F52_007599 [Lecanicillium sp. MT-2017a]|nr:hypothetical protein K4F52_007599 [Lecanicillium sp. MT-2017a]
MLSARVAATVRRVPLRPLAHSRRTYATKPVNPATQFYKTFTRPIAKVLLVAVFTYQVAYWGWLKLEADEVRADTDAVIEGLEKTVNEYKESKSEKKNGAAKA